MRVTPSQVDISYKMEHKVLEGLFIGDLKDSRNETFLIKNSITHIISMISESSPYFQDISYLCMDVCESPQQRITPIFGECLEYIHRARASGGGVLVHCTTGVSRSAAVVAAYLLIRTSLNLEQVLETIAAVRPCINPNHGFRQQLDDWSRQQRKIWSESAKNWPEVMHDDQKRCSYLLAIHNGEIDKPTPTSSSIARKNSLEDVDSLSVSTNNNSQGSNGSVQSVNSDSEGGPQTTLVMGNAESVETTPREMSNKKSLNPTRLEKIRAALRTGSSKKAKEESKRKNCEDRANNNGFGPERSNGIHHTDSMIRSTTLPNNVHRINGDSQDTPNRSTLRAQFLPAYKSEEAGLFGNIANRQKIISSPAYPPRSRINSQSSNLSHGLNTLNRVQTRHIPGHFDRRMVRSRSVGGISNSGTKARMAASASVVKLADCEDWVV